MSKLKPEQITILERLSAGATIEDIAGEIGCSRSMAYYHLARARRALGAKTIKQAMATWPGRRTACQGRHQRNGDA